MSVTIDSLDIQIRSSAGSAKQNIEDLAKALERLNGASKVTKIVNSLERLNTALTSLRSNSGVMGQLSSLSQSLARLASLPKLTGLQSAIRELKKLPQVMNDLDSADIATFTTRIRALASALAPLATQLDAIGTAFSRLPARISQIVTGTNRMTTAVNHHSNALNHQSLNIMAAISNFQSYLGTLHAVGDAIGRLMADAIEWDGIQFRFGRAFGEDADEVYAYAQKVSDVLKINIQQFMQYSSLYGSLLSGFGMAQEKVTTISVGLTELSYDIWAAYNDRFKTLEDASEAVRSAITGEIEPIRNAGIALTEASLQEYIDSTHLAGISIEKLTEAQKSEVRYAAMVNAALNQGIVGTYAREMQTAEGAVRTLTQQLKTLGQALGSLFLPILQTVVPWLSAFVELIYEGVVALMALLGIPFQEITWDTASAGSGIGGLAESAADATDSLGGAAKAAKKLKSYTMGFDELNIIDPSSAASGGSGGAAGGAGGWGDGLDLDTLWDDSVFASASKQVDELKAKIKQFLDDWKWGIALVGVALGGLAVHKNWEKISGAGKKISGVFRTIARVADEVVMAVKGIPFAPLYSNVNRVVTAVAGFLAKITAPMWGTFAAILVAIGSAAYFLYENWDEVTGAAKKFFELNIAPKLEEIAGYWEDIKKAVAPLTEALSPLIEKAKEFIEGIDWAGVLSSIGGFFEWIGGIIVSVIGGVAAGVLSTFVTTIKNVILIITGTIEVISGLIQFVIALFTGGSVTDAAQLMISGIGKIFGGLWKLVSEPIEEFWNGVVDWFKSLYDELVGHSIVPDMIDAIVDWFLSLPDKILGPIKEFCGDILARFETLWEDTKAWWNRTVAPKLTLDYWVTKFSNIGDGLKTAIKNGVNSAITVVNSFIDWLNTHLVIEIPPITVLGATIFGGAKIKPFTIPKIPLLAEGGFPAMGQMFIAREAGPELVGRMGNRTAVANNDQIVEGVAAGVYRAVVAAMTESGSGNGQAVNVYLDGKQIYSSMKKAESERGLTLMGNQLGYAY